MGQKIAKRHADKGVCLYRQRLFKDALTEFESACRKLDKSEDLFAVLNYMCLVYMDLGRYHDVLVCAKRQAVASERLEQKSLQLEATFNMARAYERLGEYRTSIALCNRCLVTGKPPEMSPLSGYTHLCLGDNFYGLSDVKKSLKHYDRSSHVARVLCDSVLECRVYLGLGQVFESLQDHVTALQHFSRASEIARQFTADHPCEKLQRRVDVELAVVYGKLGRVAEALEICEVRISPPTYVHCIICSPINAYICIFAL